MKPAGPSVGIALLLCLGAAVGGELVERPSTGLGYVQEPAAAGPQPIMLDTRNEASCLAATVPGAVCLPPEAVFGPHRRLASVRDISWVLGTAGLRGDEVVLVLGSDPVRGDAVAALLYLAGQSQVLVLNAPMDELAGGGDAAWTPGRPRAMLRKPIHLGPWRDELIVLRDELAETIAEDRVARLLDGRPLDEYWGERIRARRGGHLPGAEPVPAGDLRVALGRGDPGPPAEIPVVAYAHDPLTGLAYFTLLRAGLGVDASVYLGGWREWADDGRLPADAVTYAQYDAPSQRAPERTPPPDAPVAPSAAWPQSLLTLAAVVTAGSFGFLLGRRTT
jgi:thiosulfate/3-mercaptopyruvate sulfurtransferase